MKQSAKVRQNSATRETMIKKLEGKTAVITGGTEGIGLAAAKLFVKEGAYVFITGRRQKELDEAVKAIGSNLCGVQGDIAKLPDLDRLYETVSKMNGRIDIVFANAGVAEFVPFGSVTEEHFEKLFNINVRGTLFTMQRPYRCSTMVVLLFSTALSRVLKVRPPSVSMPRARLPFAPSCERGLQI